MDQSSIEISGNAFLIDVVTKISVSFDIVISEVSVFKNG